MILFFFCVLAAVSLFFRNEAFAVTMSAITEDVKPGDEDFPRDMVPFTFQVDGSDVYGFVYVAEGKGPHPTAVVLHGFPGNEKNLDLAQALRRTGINAVFFSYRGAWGSEGNFSYRNCVEDAIAAADFFKKPENIHKFRADPENLIIMGHSMGGFVAMSATRSRRDIKACAFLSGWNAGYYAERLSGAGGEASAERKRECDAEAAPLKGVNGELLVEEILSMKETHNLLSYISDLKGKKIFMLTAKRDTICPTEYDHQPLYDALKKAYPNDVSELVLDTDHIYSDARMEMIRGVFEWLQSIGY